MLDKIDIKNMEIEMETIEKEEETYQEELEELEGIVEKDKTEILHKLIVDIFTSKQNEVKDYMIELMQSQDTLKFASFAVIEIANVNSEWVFRTSLCIDYINIEEIIEHPGKYFLTNNFKCSQEYNNTEELIFDGRFLETCRISDLARLLYSNQNGNRVVINNISQINLTEGDYIQDPKLYFCSKDENQNRIQIFIKNVEFQTLVVKKSVTGTRYCQLIIDELKKTNKQDWQIESDEIDIISLSYQNTNFEYKEEGTTLTKIWTNDNKIYFKELTNQPILFEEIVNTNQRIIGDENQVKFINSFSGWD